MNSEKYIGLDVHQATISVAVMDSRGKVSCDLGLHALWLGSETCREFAIRSGSRATLKESPGKSCRQTGS